MRTKPVNGAQLIHTERRVKENVTAGRKKKKTRI